VSLDGGAAQTVDLYSARMLFQQRVYRTGLLTEGAHRLVITWGAAKNPASSGYLIDLDAVGVLLGSTP
jgi:hypothetical protein